MRGGLHTAWASCAAGLFRKRKKEEAANPLPPVLASCRGDGCGMQLDGILMSTVSMGTQPKAGKVDLQDPGPLEPCQASARGAHAGWPGPQRGDG